MVGPLLGALLGPITGVVDKVVDRLVVDKNLADRVKGEIEKEWATAETRNMFAQLEINKVEAAHSSIFVAGWRPFVGWVGGAGFAVQFVVVPLVGYVYSLFGSTAPPPLELDPMLYTIVLGILGLGIGTRTYEKVKGVAAK